MTPIAVICAAVTALCVGYQLGRRASSTPSTWKKRTSRATLGRAALSLILLMVARRVQRRFLAKHALSNPVGVWALKFAEPLHLLRSGFWLQRFH